MSDESTLARSEFGYWGYSQPDNGVAQMYVRLRDFGAVELALYSYLYARKWNKDDDGDFKQGACNISQETIADDLSVSVKTIRNAVGTLERYGLIRTDRIKRKHGGRAQIHYWPMEPIYNVETFLAKYGDDLREGHREKIEAAAKKQRDKVGTARRMPVDRKRVVDASFEDLESAGYL